MDGATARRWAPLGAGLAAALAILTRPNLAPVAIVPAAFLVWRGFARGGRGEDVAGAAKVARWWPLFAFTLPVLGACLAVAAILDQLYGSPLRSGYEAPFLSLAHLGPNLALYPRRLTELQTPAIWLALLAPWVARRERGAREVAGLALAFAAVVLACYVFYPAYDSADTLRFLVPAIPALIVLLAIALTAAPLREPVRGIVLGLAVAALAAISLARAHDLGAFDQRGDRKYAVMGQEVARRLPADAIVLAMQHSGSVRYYAGRDIVRYDLVSPQGLDRLIKRCLRRGLHPYLVLESWEVAEFDRRFAGHSVLAPLDWPAMIELERAGVRLWDASDRVRGRPASTRATVVVPWPYPG